MKKRTRASPPRETTAERKKRARKILAGLRRAYPGADCALTHQDPLQLLVSTILSAQSTDETVNKVTPVLFERYRTAQALADASPEQVEEIIRSTGFFHQKAKSIRGACRKIVEDFAGRVPEDMDALTSLPGVARKTANVVLGTAFRKNDGFVVDTHVGRLATRMGLTWSSKTSKDAVKIERDLMEIIPRQAWTFMGHALIWHGRRVCNARKPACDRCALAAHCPSAGAFEQAR